MHVCASHDVLDDLLLGLYGLTVACQSDSRQTHNSVITPQIAYV
jgi:hypothetical protein